jgi:4-hydroxy-2-oxoheptanedioate aldolase
MPVHPFVTKLKNREPFVGYWMLLDSAVAAERLARIGYDYVCLDMQHGLFTYERVLHMLQAIDAGDSAGVVRVPTKDPGDIGMALDLGARAIILPLVESAEEAARLASAARYLPEGTRSFGPLRSGLRVGPRPADANREVAVIAMIETAAGLADVEAIAATPGVDAIYVGPADLTLSLGGTHFGDTSVSAEFEAALARVRAAAEAAGIASGMHCLTGEDAAKRLAEGFTFASLAGDLGHLERSAATHLAAATAGAGVPA